MLDKMQLMREYEAMRARTEEAVKAARERKKEELKIEIAAIRQDHKLPFARRLLEAREAGMKRADLLEVIGTQSGDRLKELIELAGGSMRRLTTANERIERAEQAVVATVNELLASLGIRHSGKKDRADFPTGREYHHFTVDSLNEDFYLHENAPWPLANASDEMYAWLKANEVTLRTELAPHYEEEGVAK